MEPQESYQIHLSHEEEVDESILKPQTEPQLGLFKKVWKIPDVLVHQLFSQNSSSC